MPVLLGGEATRANVTPVEAHVDRDYDGTDDLAEAQRAKYDRVLNRAGITAGANVLEIGCGWGGFAEAATTVGASITGVTLAVDAGWLVQAPHAQYQLGNPIRDRE